jgi:Spy/CpxP family protein refolding chaperone
MLKFRILYLPILWFAGMGALCAQDNAPKGSTLTDEQKQVLRQKVQALENDTKAQSEKLNAKIAETAKNIDRNLLSGKPDDELDRKLSADFSSEVSQLVSSAIQAKLSATREMVKVLTPDQKAALLAELEKPGANPDITELINKVLAK